MKTGKIEFSPDYGSPKATVTVSQKSCSECKKFRSLAVKFARDIFYIESIEREELWSEPRTNSAVEASEFLLSVGLVEKKDNLYRWIGKSSNL